VLALAGLDPSQLVATANVTGLTTPGAHAVTLTFQPPDGAQLVSIDPADVSVTITPPAAPSPLETLIPTP
jgi:hypothetical protein